ncbi:MAG: hypothetical protein JRC86_11930 [Deltaproteobacteria bacterium]|nr:hypothetical protein [Deltaproteobacteria bacterium]
MEWEKRKPRKKIGIEKWLELQKGPEPRKWGIENIYEDNGQYLARLGLLEPWEIEILSK